MNLSLAPTSCVVVQSIMQHLYAILSIGIALSLSVGCSSQPSGEVVNTVSAGGVLEYQGKVLEFYQVTFFPTDGGRPAIGVTDTTGKFVLGTNRPGDGAIVGKHKVAIIYVGPPSTNPEEGMTEFSTPPPPKIKLPSKYSNAETSELQFDIPDAGNPSIEIHLK